MSPSKHFMVEFMKLAILRESVLAIFVQFSRVRKKQLNLWKLTLLMEIGK